MSETQPGPQQQAQDTRIATAKDEPARDSVNTDTTSTTATASTTITKTTTITASFVVPAVAKPLPTPALPFQSARASESLYSSSYSGTSKDRERDRGRHRDRYSRERSHDREYDRDRDYNRHDRGYRNDYRYHGDHSSDRDYRGYKHDRPFRDKDHDGRPGHREYDYDDSGGARSGTGSRYDAPEGERERGHSAGQWHEGDDDGDSHSMKGHDRPSRDFDYDRDRGRGRDRDRERDRYRNWDRNRGYDYEGDRYGANQDWDERDRAPRDRDLDVEKAVAVDDLDLYRPLHRPSRDHSLLQRPLTTASSSDDITTASGMDHTMASTSVTNEDPSPLLPAMPIEPVAAKDTITVSTTSSTHPLDTTKVELSMNAPSTVPNMGVTPPQPRGAVDPLSQSAQQQDELMGSAPSSFVTVPEQASAIPRPPLPLQIPVVTVQSSVSAAAQTPVRTPTSAQIQAAPNTSISPVNGHLPPPPPPPLPPVAPHGYVPQTGPPPSASGPPTDAAYPPLPPSGNAPPPPRRSTADDDYYGSHGHYYRHSRSSNYRDGWHGSDADHRYESRRSHGRWYPQYPDYDRHSRAPSPRIRDRYDYSHQDSGGQRAAGMDSNYPVSGHHDVPGPHPEARHSPITEQQSMPGYNGPYPGDPAMPHGPPTPVAPVLKGEDLYERVGQVGEGTYGKVYKARNKQTGEYVALKRIRMEAEKDGFPITAMREIKLLQSLNHPHVISLKELMVSKGAVYMVFEYMDYDLTGILSHPHLKFQPKHVKCLMKQLLEGLGFLHHKGVLHRDIKGSNLLVNKLGELKLADFGLARVFQKKMKRDYTNRVITLWYRPPELILGATGYGPEVDMWSAGCIMVELFTRRPIFQGNNEITQLENIWKTMGTPQKESWPGVDQLPWYELIKHLNTESRASRFREMFGKLMSPAALDLAEALLSLNPKRRPTAVEALHSFAYFTEEEPAPCRPEELPKIDGDWHEYESKQRKKANAKPKAAHPPPQPPQHHVRQQSEGDRQERQDQDKAAEAVRPAVSKKHGLGGSTNPAALVSTTDLTAAGSAALPGIDGVAAPEQKPDVVMTIPSRAAEPIIAPPAVSPSYLPYSSILASQAPPPRRPSEPVSTDYRGPVPQPPLPPPPPPAPPMFGDRSLPELPPQAVDPAYMPDPHRNSLTGDDHHRGQESVGPGFDYYNRNRHYDYARDRDRDRDRERERERFRDYSRRRGDYRNRE
ncbi:kinase subunit of RNA polymerase II carboxy-terminal domain kinase I, partial [Mortierella sp. GBA35]